MITSIEQFAQYWTKESAFTQSVMNTLTDSSLKQSVDEGHRTLGRVAWHIVETIPEMMNRAGLKLDPVGPPAPEAAQKIRDAYAGFSKALLEQVKKEWNDDTLRQEDDMYGEKWKRGLTLMVLMQHEIHHRGQMTVLMRQAGLKVPSIYGPAKEGWAQYGMPVPEI